MIIGGDKERTLFKLKACQRRSHLDVTRLSLRERPLAEVLISLAVAKAQR